MFNVYFQYEINSEDGMSDYSKDFDSKAEAWQYVCAVRKHALDAGIFLSLVIYGDFDEKSQSAPELYELVVTKEYVRETRYRKHAPRHMHS
jgi:hypothetical protein